MGFTYLDKFTYLNTFVIQVARRCSDNQGPTVLCCSCWAKLEAYISRLRIKTHFAWANGVATP